MKVPKNVFDMAGKWFKANLHTHTTASDGMFSVTEAIAAYRKAGYHILAITDHWKTNDITGRSDKKMLVISGMEFHPSCPSVREPYHLVALNVPHEFKFTELQLKDANRAIAKVRRAGGEVVLAHPYWCGMAFEDFRQLKGLAAIEVYNTICGRIGRACSENEWTYAMEHGMSLPGIAVDDTHCNQGDELFGGWTWLKLPALTVENVLNALRAGHCYASNGPTIDYFGIQKGKLVLRCSSAAEIHFITKASGGASRKAAQGCSIKEFTMHIPDAWPFVRARVTDHTGKMAWTPAITL